MRAVQFNSVDVPPAESQASMSDDMLRKYERNTTKRPLLCFAILAALPFANELLCRILESL